MVSNYKIMHTILFVTLFSIQDSIKDGFTYRVAYERVFNEEKNEAHEIAKRH